MFVHVCVMGVGTVALGLASHGWQCQCSPTLHTANTQRQLPPAVKGPNPPPGYVVRQCRTSDSDSCRPRSKVPIHQQAMSYDNAGRPIATAAAHGQRSQSTTRLCRTMQDVRYRCLMACYCHTLGQCLMEVQIRVIVNVDGHTSKLVSALSPVNHKGSDHG